MWQMGVAVAGTLALTFFVCVPPAWGQQASSIAGLVSDSSGAVLPGVTVEATSPALTEKARGVVTDGEGRYNIVDLRPGTYTVTFTLTGFTTLRREGIQLTAGFTARVNADLQIGALEETVTVTGASPLVDVQNVRQQTVVSDALHDRAAEWLASVGHADHAGARNGGRGRRGRRIRDLHVEHDLPQPVPRQRRRQVRVRRHAHEQHGRHRCDQLRHERRHRAGDDG